MSSALPNVVPVSSAEPAPTLSIGDRWVTHEHRWFRDVNAVARHTPWLHEPAQLFARYGVIVFVLLLLVAWWRHGRRTGVSGAARALWAPLGVLLAVALNQPVGRKIAEPRPYAVLHHVLVLVPRTTDVSFPSDHAVMAGATAAGILLVSRRLGLLTAALAVLIAADRVYVGAHWPLDVVAGLAFGAIVSFVGFLVVRRPLEAVVRWLDHGPAAVLVRAAS